MATLIIMLASGSTWQADKSLKVILVDPYGDDDDHDDDDIGIPPAITTSLEAPFVPSPTPSSSPLAFVQQSATDLQPMTVTVAPCTSSYCTSSSLTSRPVGGP